MVCVCVFVGGAGEGGGDGVPQPWLLRRRPLDLRPPPLPTQRPLLQVTHQRGRRGPRCRRGGAKWKDIRTERERENMVRRSGRIYEQGEEGRIYDWKEEGRIYGQSELDRKYSQGRD